MNLKSNIIQELKEFDCAIPPHLSTPYSFPENYFHLLPETIMGEIILNEQTSQWPKTNPYSVSNEYFSNLSAQIENEIPGFKIKELLPAEHPYLVPNQYFESNLQNLQALVKADGQFELHNKQMPYDLPADYFDNQLSEIIVKVNVQEKELKQVSFIKSFKAKFALAATVLLFMGLAFKGIIEQTAFQSENHGLEQKLAILSDTEVDAYFSDHEHEIDYTVAMSQIDESKLDLHTLENEVFDQAFQDVSDEDLSNYKL